MGYVYTHPRPAQSLYLDQSSHLLIQVPTPPEVGQWPSVEVNIGGGPADPDYIVRGWDATPHPGRGHEFDMEVRSVSEETITLWDHHFEWERTWKRV